MNALSIAASFTVMNPMLLVYIKLAPGVVVAGLKVGAGWKLKKLVKGFRGLRAGKQPVH